MKDTVILAIGFFIFGPWVFGMLDVIWWFFTGHATGMIPWSVSRVALAIAWPFILGFIAAGLRS